MDVYMVSMIGMCVYGMGMGMSMGITNIHQGLNHICLEKGVFKEEEELEEK